MFSEVANEPGVRKAFCELVPEELWNQRIQMMSVPDNSPSERQISRVVSRDF